MQHQKEIKIQQGKQLFYLAYLPVSIMTYFYEFTFIKRIKIPYAESCDVV